MNELSTSAWNLQLRFKKWKGEDKKDEDKKKAEFPGGVSAAVDEVLLQRPAKNSQKSTTEESGSNRIRVGYVEY